MRFRSPIARGAVALLALAAVLAPAACGPELTTPEPEPFVEHDLYSGWAAEVTLARDGVVAVAMVQGVVSMDVHFEDREGEANDDDGNGTEEVVSEFTAMSLTGLSPFGVVEIGVVSGTGTLEERANPNPGVLDVPPFTGAGTAAASFEVVFEVTIDGEVYRAADPQTLFGAFHHKPAAAGDILTAGGTVALLDAGGAESEFELRLSRHWPRGRFVEHDLYSSWSANLTLARDGTTSTAAVEGDVSMDVFFEAVEGRARDGDGNDLEEVAAVVTAMSLTGTSAFGPIEIGIASGFGTLEETSDDTPNVLDVPPFAGSGSVEATLDMVFEITVDGETYRAADPQRLFGLFTHKPAASGDVLISPRDAIVLLDESGEASGFELHRTRHWPGGRFVEHDVFSSWAANVTIAQGDAAAIVGVEGDVSMDVFFEHGEGDADDDDGNGLGDVVAAVTAMELTGSSAFGTVEIGILASGGTLEERDNDDPATLDVPPFTSSGSVDATLDLLLRVTIDGEVYHTAELQTLEGIFHHKPAAAGDVLDAINVVELLDAEGEPSGFVLRDARHWPRGRFVEHDRFTEWAANVTLLRANAPFTVGVEGEVSMEVFFEYREGDAEDDDGNGLDEVAAAVTAMELTGTSPYGAVEIGVVAASGMLMELANVTANTLDVPPFISRGTASLSLDAVFTVTIAGEVYRAADPKAVQGVISHKPATEGDFLDSSRECSALVDASGSPSDYELCGSRHWPAGRFVEHDRFEGWAASVTIARDDVTATVPVDGRVSMDVFFEYREGAAHDDDGDGLDEVVVAVTEMELTGPSPFGPVEIGAVGGAGTLREGSNATPSTLDVPPFTPQGLAGLALDIAFTVTIDGEVLHVAHPQSVEGVISHKPPALGDVLEAGVDVPLLDADGVPSGYTLQGSRHWPLGRFVEHDRYTGWIADVTVLRDGTAFEVAVEGEVSMDVFFEHREGEADDDDGNGLDEVIASVTDMQLTGSSQQLGTVDIGVVTGTGVIEERDNSGPGVLDLPPFAAQGIADVRLDIVWVVTIDGVRMFAEAPQRLAGIFSHKPAGSGDALAVESAVRLLLANGEPTGFEIAASRHEPNPGG